jgi:hypothetical protein
MKKISIIIPILRLIIPICVGDTPLPSNDQQTINIEISTDTNVIEPNTTNNQPSPWEILALALGLTFLGYLIVFHGDLIVKFIGNMDITLDTLLYTNWDNKIRRILTDTLIEILKEGQITEEQRLVIIQGIHLIGTPTEDPH